MSFDLFARWICPKWQYSLHCSFLSTLDHQALGLRVWVRPLYFLFFIFFSYLVVACLSASLACMLSTLLCQKGSLAHHIGLQRQWSKLTLLLGLTTQSWPSDTIEINLTLKTLMSNPMLTSLLYKTPTVENLFSY